MARKSKTGVLKRLREVKKAEKAALKRDQKAERKELAGTFAGAVASKDDLEGYGFPSGALEPVDGVRVGDEARGDHLQSDPTLQGLIEGLVNDSHPTASNLPDHMEVRKPLSGLQRPAVGTFREGPRSARGRGGAGGRETVELSFQVGLLRQELPESLGVLGILLQKLLRRQSSSGEAPVHVLGDDVPEPRTLLCSFNRTP